MATGLEFGARTPETFQAAQLLATDFDNTVTLSLEPSPQSIGVIEAHDLTIDAVFGVKSVKQFHDNGGLKKSPAPKEIVQDLAPDCSGAELDRLVQRFIDTKLDIVMGEIGTRFPDGSVWPRPTAGYLELREQLEIAREDGQHIDDLILSSGHEPFIRKTYQVWGVSQPTHIVAEEATRAAAQELHIEQPVKPSSVLMQVARNIWRQGYGMEATEEPNDELSRMVYVGDDAEKDGRMAQASGVEFFLIQPDTSSEVWQSVATRLQLGQATLRGTA